VEIGEDPDARDLHFAGTGRDINAARGIAWVADGDINGPVGEGVEAAEELVLEGSP
jgi:hypothetical protein